MGRSFVLGVIGACGPANGARVAEFRARFSASARAADTALVRGRCGPRHRWRESIDAQAERHQCSGGRVDRVRWRRHRSDRRTTSCCCTGHDAVRSWRTKVESRWTARRHPVRRRSAAHDGGRAGSRGAGATGHPLLAPDTAGRIGAGFGAARPRARRALSQWRGTRAGRESHDGSAAPRAHHEHHGLGRHHYAVGDDHHGGEPRVSPR